MLGGGSAARDGDIQYLDATSGAEPVQLARAFGRDCAHLQYDGFRPRSSKNSRRFAINVPNRIIVGQARENHVDIARQLKNIFRHDSAPLSDGFHLGEIPVVYTDSVSVIKQPLRDPTSHIA